MPKGLHNSSRTHCIRGHPFDDDNTYVTSYGNRKCRACNQARHIADRKNRRIRKGKVITRYDLPEMLVFAKMPVLHMGQELIQCSLSFR